MITLLTTLLIFKASPRQILINGVRNLKVFSLFKLYKSFHDCINEIYLLRKIIILIINAVKFMKPEVVDNNVLLFE